MRLALIAALSTCAGCIWIGDAKFDETFDADGDGFGIDEDCAPHNPDVYPFAPDWRGDRCDADCGEESDRDGDDWPDGADCAPDDPDIFPCAPEASETDGVDSDCGGQDGFRDDDCLLAQPDPAFALDETPELDAECNPLLLAE